MSVAAIDIGSNSLRLLILDDEGCEVTRDATVTGLGSGVEKTGRFDPTTYAATMSVIERYARSVAVHGVTKVEAVATSASRDADNGPDLMDDIESVLGVRPRVISGDLEAALAYAGATSALTPRESKLVIDIGGGSTEFIFGDREPTYAVSVDIGSVRLTDRCVGGRPISTGTIHAIRRECADAFSIVEIPGVSDIAIGVAGTFTSLVAMAMELDRYDRDHVHGSVLHLGAITGLVDYLARLTLDETASIPSLDPLRAPVMFAGAVIAEQALERCALDAVRISENDLLDGLAATGSAP